MAEISDTGILLPRYCFVKLMMMILMMILRMKAPIDLELSSIDLIVLDLEMDRLHRFTGPPLRL